MKKEARSRKSKTNSKSEPNPPKNTRETYNNNNTK